MLIKAHQWISLSGSDIAGWGIALFAWCLVIPIDSMELGNSGQPSAMLIRNQSWNRQSLY
jgi:uncharacterized protein (DUF486 family)